MKKYLVAVALIFPLIASAQTADSPVDLQVLIKQLQTQIQSLQAQIVDLKAEVQSVKLELKFGRALAQGATGDDVKQLQEFLKNFTGSYPDGSITGYFGPRTEAAVKRFQEQNGIESVGIVGPITQNKLNMLVTAIPGTPAVSAPGTVMSPAPTSITTGFNVSLASNNPFAEALISPAASTATRVPVLAVNLTSGNDGAMTVYGLRFHEKGILSDSSISGAYLVENGKVLYEYSSISDGVIGFSGLSLSVAAGQTRTMWLVIDITSNLSVGNNVSFGLNAASDVTVRDASNNSVEASGSFPVIGNVFTATSVSNLSPAPAPPVTTPSAVPAIPVQSSGQTTTQPATLCKTPSSVQVPFTPTVIKILSPNGGEQWQIGGTYTIKYSAKDIAGNKALLVYLNKGYDAPTTKTGVNSSQLIGVTTNLESYTYTVSDNVQAWPGLGSNYSISIYVEGSYSSCDAISYIGDSSDAEFSIVAGQVNVPAAAPTTPGIPVTTTSGGGYGAAAPMPTPAPTLSPTILTTQEKIANIQSQIAGLQEKLNTTTDTATRDSLKAQIAALQTVIQELQNQIFQGQPLPVSTPAVPAAPALSGTTSAPVPVQGTSSSVQVSPANQDKINNLYEQINALGNQLNSTIDTAKRDSLVAQIMALKTQVQALQSTTAPTVQGTP